MKYFFFLPSAFYALCTPQNTQQYSTYLYSVKCNKTRITDHWQILDVSIIMVEAEVRKFEIQNAANCTLQHKLFITVLCLQCSGC